MAWRTRGHDIKFGVRNPDDRKYASLGIVTTNADAVGGAEVVVLCTPWQGTRQAVRDCGDLSGKTLIDCTNPLLSDMSGIELGRGLGAGCAGVQGDESDRCSDDGSA